MLPGIIRNGGRTSQSQTKLLIIHVQPYRTDPSSSLPTLSSYLKATRPLLAIILQIPPMDPQGCLRTAFLLRLTGDVLSSIPGYHPLAEVLPELLDWLDELDRGWLAVLRLQVWDSSTKAGVDLQMSADAYLAGRLGGFISMSNSQTQPEEMPPPKLSPVSQTDRTRLRSLLMVGSDRLEDWMENLRVDGADDVESALEALGLRERFEELFFNTLNEMGELS